MNYPNIQRRPTRHVTVGRLTLGANAPVLVQSMTNTLTSDLLATLRQVETLAAIGADLVRVAVPRKEDTAALAEIVRHSPVPIVADVHFHFERALEAIDAGVAKIRLNPGNLGDRDQVRRVITAADEAGVAIRVGVNEGSVVDPKNPAELARPLDELMADKLGEYLNIFEEMNFKNLVLSAKSHDAYTTVAVNRRIAQRWDYPIHLGVTHAGTRQTGAIRSAAALGALLGEGIGDTIRISFAGDPVHEVTAGLELLYSLRLRPRRGIELIACPTCGRIQMDTEPLIEAIRAKLADVEAPVTVAVMGCVVNGPGEAQAADVAICAGKGKAVLYRRGVQLRTVAEAEIVQAVIDEVRSLIREGE